MEVGFMFILIDGVRYILRIPKNEAELETIVEKNYKYIFGEDSFYFNMKRKLKSNSGIATIPDGYLINFNKTPEWFIIEVELSSHRLYEHIIPQLSKFMRAVEDVKSKKILIDMLYNEIKANNVLEAKIRNKIGSGEIYKFVDDLISVKPKIIIIIDEKTTELYEVIRDLQGDIKIMEFKIFRRENITEEVDVFLYDSVINSKNVQPPIPPSPGPIVLPEGLKLFRIYKRIKLEAEVVTNSRIKFKNEIFNSPSSAAVFAIQSVGSKRKTEDGWRFWKYIDLQTGQEKILDELRK